jgi:type VI secretion system protein ImpB
MHPRMVASVDNHLSKHGGQTNIELKFKSMDDFSPVSIVRQVDALRKLFESRQKLNDLLAKLDGNDTLDGMLQEAVASPDNLKQLKAANATEGDKPNA